MEQFLEQNTWVLVAIVLWTLPWKGYALWHAAKLNHKKWFIAILVLNTLAILEIFYIFVVIRKEKRSGVQNNNQ